LDVLIAHADAEARTALAQGLADGDISIREASGGEAARSLLSRADGPRVALLDWDLPGMGGLDVCRLLREARPPEAPYLIVVTAPVHDRDVTEAAMAGADDFLVTPVTAAELRSRVAFARAAVEARIIVPRPGEAELSLRCFDPLTRVGDRAQVVRRLEEELVRSRRERVTLGIGILDVDGLNAVNEQHGHAAGDEVLREVAHRLKGTLRPYDVVGRLESDEFLIIIPRTGESDVGDALDRVRQVMAARPFCHGTECLAITVTVAGVTGAEEKAEELIAMARPVLSEAKAAGGDSVVAGVKAVLESVLTDQWSS